MVYLINQTHEHARRIVELYLEGKGCVIKKPIPYYYTSQFIKDNKLGTKSRPNISHTFDIETEQHLIEIDDYQKHSKPNQKINDGLVNQFVANYLDTRFYRLQKEEIVNDKGIMQPTAAQYLKEHLF